MLSQRQEDLEDIEAVTTRPAWVVDHNTYKLWEQGLDESMMPADIVFSEETAEQVKRMLAWAAARVAELDDARLQPQAAPPQPPPQPSQEEGPRVRGTEGPSLALLPRLPPAAFDGAVLARAAALAAGPRVGVSPTSVMQHE